MRDSSARRHCPAFGLSGLGLGLGLIVAQSGSAQIHGQVVDAVSAGGLHYRIEGRGPDVVLIHAFQMDLREWDEVVPALASSRRAVRYDVRGHGQSQVLAPLPSSAADSGVVTGRAEDRPHDPGWRVDGIQHRAGLRTDVSGARRRPDSHLTRSRRHQGVSEPRVDAADRRGGARPEPATRGRTVVGEPADGRRPGARSGGTAFSIRCPRQHTIWTLPAPPPRLDPPAGERLHEIRVPVLAVAGALDPSGSVEFAKMIVAGVAQGRSEVIPDAGHMLSIEKPEAVSRLILGWKGTERRRRRERRGFQERSKQDNGEERRIRFAGGRAYAREGRR